MTAAPGAAPGSLAGLSLEWTGRHHSESGDFADLTTHTVTYTTDADCYVTAAGRTVGEASYTYLRLDEQVGVCIYRPTEYQGRSGVVLNAIFDFAAMTDRAVITADGVPFAVAEGVMRVVPTPAGDGSPPGPPQAPPGPTPGDELWGMITGYWVSQAVHAAAKLDIADLLASGPRSCADLAQEAGVESGPLFRLLRALASVGVFREDDIREGWFDLTPTAELLRSDVAGSQRGFALLQEYQYPPWGQLLHSLRSGETAFEQVYGEALFDFLDAHPDASSVFDDAMADRTAEVADAVADAYDFTRFDVLVDVGGGSGLLLRTILRAAPGLRGVLFDLPHVAAAAQDAVAEAGLTDRCVTRGGDFFESVPSEGDLYLLKWIIHDWDDDRAVRLLRRCRDAMDLDDALLLVEELVPPGNTSAAVKWVDLTMLTVTGGRERTESDYRTLLASAGLELARVIPTSQPVSILECRRASGVA